MTLEKRIAALEEKALQPQMSIEMRMARIRQLCNELGYPPLPPDDSPDYESACNKLLEELRKKHPLRKSG